MYRILAVDDDQLILEVLRKILVKEGFEVLLASNAAEALKACAQSKPDLLLLDVNLPDAKGIDLCSRIKADDRLKHIPILLVTGEALAVESCVEGLEAGAEDYIRKPFLPQELLSRVKAVLKASQE